MSDLETFAQPLLVGCHSSEMLPALTPSTYSERSEDLAFGGISDSQPEDANPYRENEMGKGQMWVLKKKKKNLRFKTSGSSCDPWS